MIRATDIAPIPDLATHHAEEAAFLLVLRAVTIAAPQRTLDDLARLDERIEAHLDGLRIAGAEGWDACVAELESGAPGAVFAAAVLALDAPDSSRLGPVLDIAGGTPDGGRGLAAALAWLPEAVAATHLGGLLGSTSPNLRMAGIEAAVAHGHDPGVVLEGSLIDEASSLREQAYAAVGRLRRTDLLPLLSRGIDDPEARCRFRAAWSGGLLGDARAVAALRRLAEEDGPFREPAAAAAARRMPPAAARTWQRELASLPGGRRAAVVAAAAIGDPALLPWLVERMEVPALARLAGEAFTFITGVDLREARLEGSPPADLDAGPTEAAEDEDVGLDPDEYLAWPEPARVKAWCAEGRAALVEGARHLLGRPIDEAWLRHVLRHGRQRQRAAAAIELATLRTCPLFDVAAPAPRQLARLASP